MSFLFFHTGTHITSNITSYKILWQLNPPLPSHFHKCKDCRYFLLHLNQVSHLQAKWTISQNAYQSVLALLFFPFLVDGKEKKCDKAEFNLLSRSSRLCHRRFLSWTWSYSPSHICHLLRSALFAPLLWYKESDSPQCQWVGTGAYLFTSASAFCHCLHSVMHSCKDGFQ